MNPAVESISAFFPCYNDEATIASMVNLAFVTIDRVGAEGEVIVIDDGSTDDTQDRIARDWGGTTTASKCRSMPACLAAARPSAAGRPSAGSTSHASSTIRTS